MKKGQQLSRFMGSTTNSTIKQIFKLINLAM